MLAFIKKHTVKILVILLLITFFRSCFKNSEIRKLNKANIEIVKESQSKDSLLNSYKQKVDSFPEKMRQNSLSIHQEYDLWISKKDRGPQLMELHTSFVKPKIQALSK